MNITDLPQEMYQEISSYLDLESLYLLRSDQYFATKYQEALDNQPDFVIEPILVALKYDDLDLFVQWINRKDPMITDANIVTLGTSQTLNKGVIVIGKIQRYVQQQHYYQSTIRSIDRYRKMINMTIDKWYGDHLGEIQKITIRRDLDYTLRRSKGTDFYQQLGKCLDEIRKDRTCLDYFENIDEYQRVLYQELIEPIHENIQM